MLHVSAKPQSQPAEAFEAERISNSTATSTLSEAPLLRILRRAGSIGSPEAVSTETSAFEGQLKINDLNGFYSLPTNAIYLNDYSYGSFKISEPGQSIYTDIISACTAVGISNGSSTLMCHFNAAVMLQHPDEVREHLLRCIEFLGGTTNSKLEAVIYCGEDSNGDAIEQILNQKQIDNLYLRNQKDGFEGGIAYNAEQNSWHVCSYQHALLTPENIVSGQVEVAKSEQDLRDRFGEVRQNKFS